MSMADKLLVWDPNGNVVILQSGGIDASVIKGYEEMGRRAGFFDIPASVDIGNVFIRRDRLEQRPKMMARLDRDRIRADGMDVAKIMGVPAGAKVFMTDGLSEMEETADGKTLEIVSPIPARWSIRIEAFPYLPQQFEVIAE